ncbi:MAG TPA: hypothetical protein VN726_00545 [Hanamia sp.]|nr:hypothetical protein [Hanamia sp.]
MPEHYLPYQSRVRKNEPLFFNCFWFGFILYQLGSIIASSGTLNIKVCQAIQALGAVIMLVAMGILIRPKLSSGYLKVVFGLYMIWLCTIIVRINDYSLNYDFFKLFLFGDVAGGLIYLVPLILLLPWDLANYKKLFNVIALFYILNFLLNIIFIKKNLFFGSSDSQEDMVEALAAISIPSGFILLTFLYHSKKRNLLALASLVISLLFTIIRARRGMIFITSNILFLSFLMYFFNTNIKVFLIYLSILAFSIAALYTNGMYNVKASKLFGFVAERGTEDTRTGVELYFYDDMKTNDWIAGRGITGQYFAPGFEQEQVSDYRNVIETGYLQIILKGGLISLGLLLLITIPAGINGLFFSKNILSKAAGIWIFQFLINLYPQNSESFNPSYLLVWISVGICYSRSIRKMTNAEIQSQLST